MNFHITPVVRNLLFLNIAAFVVFNMFATQYFGIVSLHEPELPWFEGGSSQFQPLQVATYFFIHADLFHILFNMMFLVGIGSMLEMVIGEKRFLQYYLFCGLGAGILLTLLDPSRGQVVGASGALAGVLAAYARLFPHARMRILFLPIDFAAREFAIGVAVISAVFVLISFRNPGSGGSISHFGHLAGMVCGWLYIESGNILSKFRR